MEKTFPVTLAIFLLSLVTGVPSVQSIVRDAPENWAIMFLDPNLRITSVWTLQENAAMSPPMARDRLWFEAQGYTVFVEYGDEETMIRALLDPRVKSISYYGHGGGTVPKFGGRDATSWKNKIYQIYLRQYLSQGYSQSEAFRLAKEQTRNFGLQDVINRSCGSLVNTSIADLFVAPGKSYYGVTAGFYFPCNPFTCLSDKSDCTVTKYVVPLEEVNRDNEKGLALQNADCSQWPGSVAVWNNAQRRSECRCPADMQWNRDSTRCIEPGLGVQPQTDRSVTQTNVCGNQFSDTDREYFRWKITSLYEKWNAFQCRSGGSGCGIGALNCKKGLLMITTNINYRRWQYEANKNAMNRYIDCVDSVIMQKNWNDTTLSRVLKSNCKDPFWSSLCDGWKKHQ